MTHLPTAYRRWVDAAEGFVAPLARLMQPGLASLPLEGRPSFQAGQPDLVESFSRPCLCAAHWLQLAAPDVPAEDGRLSRHAVADWLRQGLLLGTDPTGPAYWGPTTNHHQHTCEIAALTLALQMARPWLWEPFSPSERGQIASWMGGVRGTGLYRNNHLFFGVLALEFLRQEGFGKWADGVCVRRWLDTLESMSLGGGWFIDGANETADYYNAYSFHYYGLWWGRLYGARDPARAGRWRDWTREFLADHVHFFAASGEPVPFGRSLTYRFGPVAPVALAEWCGASPLPPGRARRLCTRSLEYFLAHPIYQAQGALSLGWTDEFPDLAEAYSCPGSPYWAAKGLTPLLLPPESAFWTDPEQGLPCETGDTARPIPSVGLVVRGHRGEVELLNAATSISPGNTPFGPWKWGKLSYRTGTGFEIAPESGACPPDAALTAEAPDGTRYGRQTTHPLAVEADHLSCAYVLGARASQFSVQVETDLWWRGGWQFHLHRYTAHQRCRLRLGAQSLGAGQADGLTVDGTFPFVRARNATHGVALQSLAGFQTVGEHWTVAGQNRRVHLRAENSLTLCLETGWLNGEGWLAALVWVGLLDEYPTTPWEVTSMAAGRWNFRRANEDIWKITGSELPPRQRRSKPRS